MYFTISLVGIAASFFAVQVSAHGLVTGLVAGQAYYTGYSPSFQYQKPPPTVIGWSIPQDSDTGFVSDYSSPDMTCHKGATPGGSHAEVAAGSTVQIQWTKWPHPGPVIDYLAKCPGDCETVDKSSLQFFKIGEDGMLDDGVTYDHRWAADVLASNNNSWNVVIPKYIASGNYVLRHEIIALHQAQNEGGAQNYPQCLNLQVTGGGSDNPPGIAGTALYKADDPGIKVNIYTSSLTYTIPGPSLYSGAIRATQAGLSSANAQGPTSSAGGAISTTSMANSQAASSPYVTPAENAAATPKTAPSSYISSAQTIYSSPGSSSASGVPTPTSSVAMISQASSGPESFTTAPSVVGSALLSEDTPSVRIITYTMPIAPPGGSNYSAPAPDTPLPPGMTLRDFLGWVEFAIKSALNSTKRAQPSARSVSRKHSRDLKLAY